MEYDVLTDRLTVYLRASQPTHCETLTRNVVTDVFLFTLGVITRNASARHFRECRSYAALVFPLLIVSKLAGSTG